MCQCAIKCVISRKWHALAHWHTYTQMISHWICTASGSLCKHVKCTLIRENCKHNKAPPFTCLPFWSVVPSIGKVVPYWATAVRFPFLCHQQQLSRLLPGILRSSCQFVNSNSFVCVVWSVCKYLYLVVCHTGTVCCQVLHHLGINLSRCLSQATFLCTIL